MRPIAPARARLAAAPRCFAGSAATRPSGPSGCWPRACSGVTGCVSTAATGNARSARRSTPACRQRRESRPARLPATAYPDPETAHIERLLAPLGFRVRAAEPERVNMLIPTIDLEHFFGGYIAKFNLARKLAEAGQRVRIVTVDPTPPLPRGLARAGRVLQRTRRGDVDESRWRSPASRARSRSARETASSRRRGGPPTTPATRSRHTSGERFLYLIQEYEPFTFVMGSWAAVAAETYSFPHAALFSTEFLRDYFAANRIGVYSGGPQPRETGTRSRSRTRSPPSRPPTRRGAGGPREHGGCSSTPAPSRTRRGTCSSSG